MNDRVRVSTGWSTLDGRVGTVVERLEAVGDSGEDAVLVLLDGDREPVRFATRAVEEVSGGDAQ